MTSTLPSFPFLSEDEFLHVCEAFVNRHPLHDDGSHLVRGAARSDIALKEHDSKPYIKITRALSIPNAASLRLNSPDTKDGAEEPLDELPNDADPEELLPSPQSTSTNPFVEYHILLSPTYRVPTLYFNLRNLPPAISSQSIDAVYAYLVPPQYTSSLRDVGVMGGISVGNHPLHGHTSFFVHPCHTAEVMRELGGGDGRVGVEEYLVLWMGIVGNAVGLREDIDSVVEHTS